MPLESYGVLKGSVVDARREDDPNTPHYQVHVRANGTSYRVAVNVKSQVSPSELLFLVDDRFRHPVVEGLPELPQGFIGLPSEPGGLALDFIRGNLFDRLRLRPLPHNLPGPDNDLSDRVEHYVARARLEHDAEVYAFGERWGPEQNQRDKIFGFVPGNGVHDIHMNQGNDPQFAHDDGVWQDGALVFRFPSTDQWVVVFLAFQSQAWHTDDVTGHAITEPGPVPGPTEPDRVVRIVGALVNPIGPAPEPETVTLLNASPGPIELAGWALADRSINKQASGPIRDAIKKVTQDDRIFVYGVSDRTVGGLDLQKPDGNVAPVRPAALGDNVPEPFKSEPAGGSGNRMHHKFVVIDFDKPTARVYLGSYNFSATADKKNGENLLLIRDRRVAVSYVVEALRIFDHYHFRVAQEEAATGARKELVLATPPRNPGEEPWWAEEYTVAQKIRDRELFA